MKRKSLKTLSLLLSLLMTVSLFAACGGGEETTEPEPKEQVLALTGFTYTWIGDTETMAAGTDFTVDSFGRIAGFEDMYDATACQYNEDGALVRVEITDKDDGNVGYKDCTYVDGALTAIYYDPNDGFHYIHDVKITETRDESGRVVEQVKDSTLTDPENGSKENDTDKYEYEYDENGYVSVVRYYIDGELDHTENLTYDENGNMLSYSCTGDEMGTYLRFNFTYDMVDADTVQPIETDPFICYQNWRELVNHIL